MNRTSVLISSRLTYNKKTGKWDAFWQVGTRNGKGAYDSKEEAEEFCKRNINRETGFT